MTPRDEKCKEQFAVCEKRFVSKLWLYARAVFLVGGILGLTWGASSWQTKTEMRVGTVEAIGIENRMELRELRSDVNDLKRMNSKLDTIVKLLKE